jgi:hypothetical protein
MVDVAREYNRKYNNTWVGAKVEGVIKPVFITGVSESEQGLRWDDMNGNRYRMPAARLQEHFQLYPTTFGMLEVSGCLFYIWKNPHRQWKAGYITDNMSMKSLQAREMELVGKKKVKKDAAGVLNFIFSPRYITVENGLKLLNRGKTLGFVINSKYAIGIKRGHTNPILFYKVSEVGTLNEDNSIDLKKEFHHLYEELSQYIPCKLEEGI